MLEKNTLKTCKPDFT